MMLLLVVVTQMQLEVILRGGTLRSSCCSVVTAQAPKWPFVHKETARCSERTHELKPNNPLPRYEFNFSASVYLRFQQERIINPLLLTCSNFLK